MKIFIRHQWQEYDNKEKANSKKPSCVAHGSVLLFLFPGMTDQVSIGQQKYKEI